MKHKRRCIEKKAFLTLAGVEKQLVWNWVNNWNSLGWYECPICLHFHLTKKNGDMRSIKVKIQSREAYLRKHFKNRKNVHKLIFERMEAMYKWLVPKKIKNITQTPSLTAQEKLLRKQKKEERQKRWSTNGWTKKNSILPIQEQKKLLANIQK